MNEALDHRVPSRSDSEPSSAPSLGACSTCRASPASCSSVRCGSRHGQLGGDFRSVCLAASEALAGWGAGMGALPSCGANEPPVGDTGAILDVRIGVDRFELFESGTRRPLCCVCGGMEARACDQAASEARQWCVEVARVVRTRARARLLPGDAPA